MAYQVLVVDDSKLARMGLAKALGSLRPDWVRLEATNADEALALVRQNPVDIAVLDFNMPGKDGLTLATELQELRPTMPIAVISANMQHEIVTKAQEIGASFLAKPLTETALSSFIETAERQLSMVHS